MLENGKKKSRVKDVITKKNEREDCNKEGRKGMFTDVMKKVCTQQHETGNQIKRKETHFNTCRR